MMSRELLLLLVLVLALVSSSNAQVTARAGGTYNSPVDRVDRSRYKTRKSTLNAPEPEESIDGKTPAERVMMVWQLTREAWTFKDGRWSSQRGNQ